MSRAHRSYVILHTSPFLWFQSLFWTKTPKSPTEPTLRHSAELWLIGAAVGNNLFPTSPRPPQKPSISPFYNHIYHLTRLDNIPLNYHLLNPFLSGKNPALIPPKLSTIKCFPLRSPVMGLGLAGPCSQLMVVWPTCWFSACLPLETACESSRTKVEFNECHPGIWHGVISLKQWAGTNLQHQQVPANSQALLSAIMYLDCASRLVSPLPDVSSVIQHYKVNVETPCRICYPPLLFPFTAVVCLLSCV